MRQNDKDKGFTLIELSIVLVIIGFIVGGVLVGRDLINAANIRAQISQIEKYNTAVNTFKLKYGYLPGDIKDPDATAFGFAARGAYAGQGDGNGLLEGVTANAANRNNGSSQTGENMMFWVDLGQAGLIPGNFSAMTATSLLGFPTKTTYSQISPYLPAAAIGNNNFLYVYSYYKVHYFGLAGIYYLMNPSDIATTQKLTVQQAHNIDTKLDDGLPMSGRVSVQAAGPVSMGATFYAGWSRGDGGMTGGNPLLPYTGATPASSTTCYDNNNVAGVAQNYSIGQNGGSGLNCALSFRFQ